MGKSGRQTRPFQSTIIKTRHLTKFGGRAREFPSIVHCFLLVLLVGCAAPNGPGRGPRVTPMSLSATNRRFDLPYNVSLDDRLQSALVRLDQRLGADLGIPADVRAIGCVDLCGPRVAMVGGDRQFYGASVPKIVIVLAFLQAHPEFMTRMPTDIERELQAVLKRSDNELAAKYSQKVGLERIQSLLLAPQYRLYDPDHGGGLWCGKHYGLNQPRRGDPLQDLSHAATVRQCLRYLLLLEQDRLGDAATCRRLRDLFAAPWADYHNDYFVAGLRNSGLTLIRKNGQWEDWHLDVARVQLPDRPVLLAGAVHHPRGPEYLAQMAGALMRIVRDNAAPDAALAAIRTPPPDAWRSHRHRTLLHDSPTAFGDGEWSNAALGPAPHCLRLAPRYGDDAVFTSRWIEMDFKFNEVLMSWNLDVPPDCGAVIELSVGRRFDHFQSPWLHVGDWGRIDEAGPRVTRFDGGKVDIDYFTSDERYDLLRYRIRAMTRRIDGPVIAVRRVAACCSDVTGMPDSWIPTAMRPRQVSKTKWARRLAVPFRNQKTVRPDLAGRICSPTSLSMVLAYYGADRTTFEVVQRCHDPEHDIYGNWGRNIQAAASFGVDGYLTRFSDWTRVESFIAQGVPIVCSIRYDQPRLIKAAPYPTTEGHLFVLCGFDANGDAEVNDPAVSTAQKGMLKYTRAELERAWFEGTGGTAYVLLPPGNSRR